MKEPIVERLRIRAEIRRNAVGRKSVQEGKPDRLADLLDEAADVIEKLACNTFRGVNHDLICIDETLNFTYVPLYYTGEIND